MIDIILFLSTTLAGFCVGRFLQKRIIRRNEVLCDLGKYISALKINVSGKQQELEIFNTEFAANASATFRECLVSHKFTALATTQKKRVEEFFASLDCNGSAQLLQNLEFYANQFESDIKESSEAVKKSSVYVKLGILLGAMVGILFL